jgi:DNA-binding transcriptional LysR family regulator
MHTESLNIFLAVAQCGSVSKAASQLGRVPSNVTTRIQQLERDMGCTLFARTGKRMTLTEKGHGFMAYAQQILALESEARQHLSDQGHGGLLRIGTMESTAASRLPHLLQTYAGRHPAVHLRMRTGASWPLVQDVLAHSLDCAFVALDAQPESQHYIQETGLQTQIIWQEQLVLLLPPGEMAAAPAHVVSRTLIAFPEGCSYRRLAKQALQAEPHLGWIVHDIPSYHAMIACVAAGMGVALLPESVLALSVANAAHLRYFPVCQADTALLWRCGYATPAFDAFRGLFPSTDMLT